jgi:hypothetical protein
MEMSRVSTLIFLDRKYQKILGYKKMDTKRGDEYALFQENAADSDTGRKLKATEIIEASDGGDDSEIRVDEEYWRLMKAKNDFDPVSIDTILDLSAIIFGPFWVFHSLSGDQKATSLDRHYKKDMTLQFHKRGVVDIGTPCNRGKGTLKECSVNRDVEKGREQEGKCFMNQTLFTQKGSLGDPNRVFAESVMQKIPFSFLWKVKMDAQGGMLVLRSIGNQQTWTFKYYKKEEAIEKCPSSCSVM